MPDTSHLTPRAREVLATYLDAGQRDIDQTATIEGMAPGYVQAMVDRYGFLELARDSDMQRTASLIAYTRRQLAEALPAAAATLTKSIGDRSTDSGHWPAQATTPVALKSALATLAMFGITPLTRSDLTLLRPSDALSSRGPDDALVARLIEAGDTHALTRLAAGLPLAVSPHSQDPALVAGMGDAPTHPRATPPQDFTSDQPGGRVGSDPLNPLNQASVAEAEYRVIADAEWEAEQSGAGMEEFAFGEQPGE